MNIALQKNYFEKRGKNAFKYKELMDTINSINNTTDNLNNMTLNSPRNKFSSKNNYSNTLFISPSKYKRTNKSINLRKKNKNNILGLKPDFLLKAKKDEKEIGKVKKNQFGITAILNSELEKFDRMLKRGYKKPKTKKDNFYDLNAKREKENQEEYHRELKKQSKIALDKLKNWDNEFLL